VIIVALVAIAAIGIISLFGDNIRNLFGASADSLAGDEVDNRGAASNSGLTDKDMSNFAMQNSAYDPGGMNFKGGSGPGSNGANFGGNSSL
jgi:pilus assembly protein Flp/PilA